MEGSDLGPAARFERKPWQPRYRVTGSFLAIGVLGVLLVSSVGRAQPGNTPAEAPTSEVELPGPEPEGPPVRDAVEPPVSSGDAPRPPPLNVEYAQYGVAIATDFNLDSGATCPSDAVAPCILGSGGGLAIRGGYRSPGPWYYGGAYEFIKMDSGNLYRLGIFQQVRGELRYHPDIGYRTSPYFTGGLGALAYGNEWGVETGGPIGMVGAGVHFELSRFAIIGLAFTYRPALIAGWTDTADQVRKLGFAQFVGLDFLLEVRSELGRR